MPADDMPAEAIAHGKRPFKVDLGSGFQQAESRALHGFSGRIGGKKARTRRFYCKTRSVDGNGFAQNNVREVVKRLNPKPRLVPTGFHRQHFPLTVDYACEHARTGLNMRCPSSPQGSMRTSRSESASSSSRGVRPSNSGRASLSPSTFGAMWR